MSDVTAIQEGAAIADDTVKESCGENHGYWYCVTHQAGLQNQLEKDSHIARGVHVLSWVCWMHGFEAP